MEMIKSNEGENLLEELKGLDSTRMKLILRAYEEGCNVEILLNNELNTNQVRILSNGLREGVNVEGLDDPALPATRMESLIGARKYNIKLPVWFDPKTSTAGYINTLINMIKKGHDISGLKQVRSADLLGIVSDLLDFGDDINEIIPLVRSKKLLIERVNMCITGSNVKQVINKEELVDSLFEEFTSSSDVIGSEIINTIVETKVQNNVLSTDVVKRSMALARLIAIGIDITNIANVDFTEEEIDKVVECFTKSKINITNLIGKELDIDSIDNVVKSHGVYDSLISKGYSSKDATKVTMLIADNKEVDRLFDRHLKFSEIIDVIEEFIDIINREVAMMLNRRFDEYGVNHIRDILELEYKNIDSSFILDPHIGVDLLAELKTSLIKRDKIVKDLNKLEIDVSILMDDRLFDKFSDVNEPNDILGISNLNCRDLGIRHRRVQRLIDSIKGL